ncbi:hypothetical protein E4U61_003824 [Claviceps capensis]|nr:hypothetical protein E4U61_003824 [Claviceps capensis]
MRYEDWDVLLFPRDCKVPLKEFKVACHVVHDPESRQLSSPFGLPTLCCFVPSLPQGSPFQVSIHSWTAPIVSQLAQSYSQHAENVKFEARLFVDGALMACTTLSKKSAWPHIISHTWAISPTPEIEPLVFPSFKEEILRQDWWVPADDLGRIKVVLSEGFLRDSMTNPFERIKNIVAFSFQHAPQEILEQSSIAWPNPSMWRSASYASQLEVPTLQCDDSESHAHSPRRHHIASGQPMNYSGNWTDPKLLSGNRRATLPVPNSGPVAYSGLRDSDWYGNSYHEYLKVMGLGMAGSLMRNDIAPRIDRVNSSTDTSMPDYVAMGSGGQFMDDALAGSLAQDAGENPAANLKVPTNTPTAARHNSRAEEVVGFPMITHNTSLPSDIADSLTNSLLNQPMPMNFQYTESHAPAAEVKSRKENRGQARTKTKPATGHPAGTNYYEHQDLRRVSQQLIIPSGSSLPIGTVDAGKTGIENSTQCCEARDCATNEGDETTIRMTSDKGAKRNRTTFTPVSSRILDDEDEPRRASPRVRMASYAEDDVASTSAT